MSILENHHVQFFLALAAASLGFFFLYGVAYLIRRYLRLRHIPGPTWANWTDLGLIFKLRVLKQDFRGITLDLDKKYGPVVKYGPRRVLFSDISASQIIYGTSHVFEKSDTYDVPSPVIHGKVTRSFISFRDEKFVTQLRRHLNPKFTTTSVLDYEHHIDDTINTLCYHIGKNSTCNLQGLLSFFTFDTICRLAFSDDTNSMGQGLDPDDTMKGGRDRFAYWNDWFSIPFIDYLINKNPLVRSASKPNVLATMTAARVQERLAKGGPNGGAGTGAYQDLMDRYFQGREKNQELFSIPTILGLTLSTIHAGSETAGHTLSNLFWALLQNPEAYEKLKKECREADLSSPPSFTEAKHLTYVEACIKESQRLYILIMNPMERTVPPEGATIAGVFLPGGTIVAINQHALSLNPSIYGPNVHDYIPERWLTCTDTQRAQMERASMAFGHGKRMCLGIHVAWGEMLKAVPEIVRRFDIELEDPEFRVEYGMKMMRVMGALPVRVRVREREEVGEMETEREKDFLR